MAKKHFDDYYNKIYAQYREMTDDIKEVEELCLNNAIAPEVLDNMKKTAEPIIYAYQNLLYVKYLLDMPNRKVKEKRYVKQHKQSLNDCKNNHGEVIQKNNREQLDKLKDIIE